MVHARAPRDVGVQHDELRIGVGQAGKGSAERLAQRIAG
jgi:hypothetical protein